MTLGKRVARIAAADAVLLIAAAVIGAAIMPLGIMGALAVLLLMVAVDLGDRARPAARRARRPSKLREADIKALPAQTERWLEAQRPALPAPAPHPGRPDRRAGWRR